MMMRALLLLLLGALATALAGVATPEEEQRLAYFREDPGVNSHHLHWHSYHPYTGARVKKDRRGELLLHMHAQILARYNVERLGNKLPLTKKLNLLEPVPEGYDPQLDNLVASRVWPARPANTRLQNLNRNGLKVSVDDVERRIGLVREAIAAGAFADPSSNTVLNLTMDGGADLLGNVVESSALAPPAIRASYGELVNHGHALLGLVHDPEAKRAEGPAVMGDVSTALRDPAFYRLHTRVLDLARDYKQSLPSYDDAQLAFPEVSVRGVDVNTEGVAEPNVLTTHWQSHDVRLSRGLDFARKQPILASIKHLQHQPFTYSIQIENKGQPKEGYVRIFLVPQLDANGKNALPFEQQRQMMVEMDKFSAKLNPGVNVVRRKSSQSALTLPFERTFRDLDAAQAHGGADEAQNVDAFNLCGCGWPQHMLVPRGTTQGMAFQLVVVVTDYAKDKVEQELKGSCNDAHILCGVQGGLYPDRRPMGYPFDRAPRQGVDSLRSFLTPNMFAKSVSVRHRDETVADSKPARP